MTRKFVETLCWLLFLMWPANAALPSPQRDEITRSPHGQLDVPCESCHSYTSWKPLLAVPKFDHDKTHYPLTGMHAKVACEQCHTKPVFSDVPKNCFGCHADIHNRKFGSDCKLCHVTVGWGAMSLMAANHFNVFPLLGAHAAVPCEACHTHVVGSLYRVLTTCSAGTCHLKEYKATTKPNHTAQGYSLNCQDCHSMDSWAGALTPQQAMGIASVAGVGAKGGTRVNTPVAKVHP